MPSQLDLTKLGKPDADTREAYNAISAELRHQYCDFVGELGKKTGDSLDWWVEATASRNEVYSDLFHELVVLELAHELAVSNSLPDSFHVDSKELSVLLKKVLEKQSRSVRITYPGLRRRLSGKLRSAISPWRSMLSIAAEWLIIRSNSNSRLAPLDTRRSLVLIDTFSIPGDGGDDRYYPGIRNLLDSRDDNILFVPQFSGFDLKSLRNRVKLLGSRKDEYLFKECLITIKDLLWCFRHLRRISRISISGAIFRGNNVATLIRKDIHSRRAFKCALRALINYRFAKQLKVRNLPVRRTIDWFENHPLDRGWNAGFKKYFPTLTTVGYAGFFPAGISFRPTRHESDRGLVADRLLIVGEGFKTEMREFDPELELDTAPALRYSSLLSQQQVESQKDRILVALPYYLDMCERILSMIIEIQDHHPEWNFCIKPHPALAIKDMELTTKVLEGNARLTSQPVYQELGKSFALITGAQASTILESAALSVPAVVITSPGYTGAVSVPEVIPPVLFRVCSSSSEVESALVTFTKTDRQLPYGQSDGDSSLIELMFTEPTIESVTRMVA